MAEKSQADIDAARIERWATSPFHPSRPQTNDPNRDVMLRAANALEYIAAQLGQINAKLKQPDADKS